MAIAPSKLGEFIRPQMWRAEVDVLNNLRAGGLVRPDAPDRDVRAAIRKAREEHEAMPEDVRVFNSPHERARVFLEPYLSARGKKWAVPLDSLGLPDEERPWWKFWG